MANRRHGQGMGGGRPFYGGSGGGGAVNPWEGGNVPGGGGNRGGMMNSFNSSGNSSNLLSQLSEPQAQLALALTKLLQPQQQQQVPSLLTMDTVTPLASNNMYNDYPQRGRLDFSRRAGRDFRRNEPYNKMYSRNRDTDHNRRSSKAGDKVQAHRTTVVSKNKNSSKNSPKTSGKGDKSEEKSQSENDKDTSKTDNEERGDGSKDDEDQKRDWKDEKNNEGKDKSDDEDENGEKMDVDGKEGDEKDGEKKDEKDKKKEKRVKDGKYAGIPTHLLTCRICQKRMWDGESFEKHMNGRAHQQMFEKVEESYRIKANMMRESIRLLEDKNSIEMDRMKRLGKKMKVQQRSHCAMCDLDFYGYLFAHRKSASHQKLKQFLHPRCDYCNKEFPTRMEWENHRHTPEHFRKKVEGLGKKKEKLKAGEIILDDDLDTITDTVGDLQEETDVVTDITEDMDASDLKSRIPLYTSKRGVGASLITEVSGQYCKPCGRFFLDSEKAEIHTRSEAHYNSFVKILNDKIAQHEEKKRKPQDSNDEGNWKRRKVASSENNDGDEQEQEQDGEQKEDEEQDGEQEGEEKGDEEQDAEQEGEAEGQEEEGKNAKDGNELYDPADSFNTTEGDAAENPEKPVKAENETDDKMWMEVNKDLDEILETAADVKQEESGDASKASTPNKAKPGPRSARARKGKKSN